MDLSRTYWAGGRRRYGWHAKFMHGGMAACGKCSRPTLFNPDIVPVLCRNCLVDWHATLKKAVARSSEHDSVLLDQFLSGCA